MRLPVWRRRCWLALILAGLAACQQPGATTSTASATPDEPKTQTVYFKPEVDALLDEVAVKLVGICVDRATSEERLDACIRDEFAQAFDDSGLGHKSCAFHASLADFLDCVAIGNAFLDVRHRLADDSPVPAGYWSGRNAMADALADTVVSRGMEACGASGGVKQITDCVETWFEQRLALPAKMVERCNVRAVGKERHECLGEAFMLRYLQDHAPRLGAVST